MIEITDIETRQSPLDQNPITVYFTIENTGIDLDYLYKVIINNQPNSIIGLLDQIKSTNSIYGRPINAKYAEGFTVNRYLGVDNFFQLK